MFYQPELIVYLWMLPVLFMVVFPALWATTRKLYRWVERSRLAEVRGSLEVGQFSGDDLPGRERRRSPRILIDAPEANVARRINCCRTPVANISHRGIFFTSIPQKMLTELDKLKVVFRTRECDYTMIVQPRWIKRGEKANMLGAEIVDIPLGWENFVNGLCRPAVAAAR